MDVIQRSADHPRAGPASTGDRLFLFKNEDIKGACVADAVRLVPTSSAHYKSADAATALETLRRVRLHYLRNTRYGCRLQFAQYEILVGWFPGHFQRPYVN